MRLYRIKPPPQKIQWQLYINFWIITNHIFDDDITYRASDMVICAHADTGYLNSPKEKIRVGDHIMLSEDNPIP